MSKYRTMNATSPQTGVNNIKKSGTARDLAIRATNQDQLPPPDQRDPDKPPPVTAKKPHSSDSPSWMLTGRGFDPDVFASAQAIKACGDTFRADARCRTTRRAE